MDINDMTPDELKAMAAQLNALAKQKQLEAKPEKETKKRKPKKLPKTIKPEQVERFMEAIDLYKINGVRDRAICESLARAGLRVSEACKLRPSDIDFKRGVLFIQEAKGLRDRKISIGPTLIDWLKKWDAIRNPEAEFFFHTRTLAPLTTRHIQYICRDTSQKAGVYVQDGSQVKPVNPHVFRATFATKLLDKGMNIKEVQVILGWENIATSEHYLTPDLTEIDRKIKEID